MHCAPAKFFELQVYNMTASRFVHVAFHFEVNIKANYHQGESHSK